MRQVWVVLRREYLERVRTKGFIIGTIALPLFMMGLMGLNVFIAVQAAGSDRELALVDFTGSIGEEVAGRLDGLGYDVEVVGREVSLEELDRQVVDDELEGYVVLDDLTLSEGVFAYRSKDSPGGTRVALFESAVHDIALDNYLATISTGEALRSLIEGGRLVFESVIEVEDQEAAEAARVTGIALGFGRRHVPVHHDAALRRRIVLRSDASATRSGTGVEVVISAITPWRLLLGKVLGVGSMGTDADAGSGAACAGVLLLICGPDGRGPDPGADLRRIAEFVPGPGVFSVLRGPFFLSGTSCTRPCSRRVGAMCATEESGQAQFPVIIASSSPSSCRWPPSGGTRCLGCGGALPLLQPGDDVPAGGRGVGARGDDGLSLPCSWRPAGGVVRPGWREGSTASGILMQGKRPTTAGNWRAWVEARAITTIMHPSHGAPQTCG